MQKQTDNQKPADPEAGQIIQGLLTILEKAEVKITVPASLAMGQVIQRAAMYLQRLPKKESKGKAQDKKEKLAGLTGKGHAPNAVKKKR